MRNNACRGGILPRRSGDGIERQERRTEPAPRPASKPPKKPYPLKPTVAEHHRILGTLCGQVIPGNVLAGLNMAAVRSIRSTRPSNSIRSQRIAYVSRGSATTICRPAFGGGPDVALKDFQKAIELDPKLAEAHLLDGTHAAQA